MATIVIHYDNIVDDSGTTFTHSTEVSGFQAENVQAAQTSEVFRTSVLNPGTLTVTADEAKPYDIVALIDCKVSAWANRILQSQDFSSPWTETNITSSVPSGILTPEGELGETVTSDTTSGGHYKKLIMSSPLATSATVNATPVFSVWAKATAVGGGSDCTKIRLQFEGDVSGAEDVKFDIENGAFISKTGSPTYSITAATDQTRYPNWYLCTLQPSAPSGSDTTHELQINLLDASGATSHTDALSVQLGSAQWCFTRPGGGLLDYKRVTTVQGAAWKFVTSAPTTYGYMAFSLGGDESSRPTASSYYMVSDAASSWAISLYDEDNANAVIDIGRVCIGPVWQPTDQTFVGLDEDSSGKYRKWTVHLGQKISVAERFGELSELRRTLQVVDPSRLRETPSGQLIAEDGAKPILVILNPDETTYGQEQLMYGWLVGMTSRRASPLQSGEVFEVTLTIWEALP